MVDSGLPGENRLFAGSIPASGTNNLKQTKMTATKKPPIYGDHLPITSYQIKEIRKNCAWKEGIKEEWVQWATEDKNCKSLKQLTQAQAVKILRQQTGETNSPPSEGLGEDFYATFDNKNPRHKLILSLCRQANWTIPHDKHGEVADLERLDKWLKSNKAPVSKPLQKMDDKEVERTIAALGGIVKSIYK